MRKRIIVFISCLIVLLLGTVTALSIYADNSRSLDPSGRRNCCKMPTYKRGEKVTDCLICDESLDYEGDEDKYCPF